MFTGMKTPRSPAAENGATFELRATGDSSGMANLRINCLVSIPTGIRILALIDAEEVKTVGRSTGDAGSGQKAVRGRSDRKGVKESEKAV